MPRSVDKIFQVQNELKKVLWKFQISISYFEIYLDQMHDLLSKNKENIISQYNQKDITSIIISSYEATMPILLIALNKRTKAETNCNEKSSRSHSIFQLKIVSKLDNSEINRNGTLNFIDLAGSERVNSSKVEGKK
jgi:kinesin family protein C1